MVTSRYFKKLTKYIDMGYTPQSSGLQLRKSIQPNLVSKDILKVSNGILLNIEEFEEGQREYKYSARVASRSASVVRIDIFVGLIEYTVFHTV